MTRAVLHLWYIVTFIASHQTDQLWHCQVWQKVWFDWPAIFQISNSAIKTAAEEEEKEEEEENPWEETAIATATAVQRRVAR